jgi:aryl-alcohol dehydrogenase-like predicted oxidoreductase
VTNRLALGAAQFGLNYGIANRTGRVDDETVRRILRRAAAAGVDTVDTAVAYGTSEASLGLAGVSSWRVISKLPALPEAADVARWTEEQVQGSLARLKVGQLDGLLLHRPADLLGARSRQYIEALAAVKGKGLVRSVGISIYDPTEIDAIWAVWRPDIVQAPCNVLDRRLLESGWLARLSEHGVRVHVRSVLLQGLLLMPREQRPAWFDPWQGVLDAWLGWCRDVGTTPLAAAVAFVRAQGGVERYVMGVDALAQLEEILAAQNVDVARAPDRLGSSDLDLLEPSRWKAT